MNEHEFSLMCANGHGSYALLRLPEPMTPIFKDCADCGAPREVIDQCPAGERPLRRARKVACPVCEGPMTKPAARRVRGDRCPDIGGAGVHPAQYRPSTNDG